MRGDVGRECHLGVGVLFVEERHGSRDRYGYLARRIVLLFDDGTLTFSKKLSPPVRFGDRLLPRTCRSLTPQNRPALTAKMVDVSRVLNTFWFIFFSLSVIADLNLVPGLSGVLRAVAKRGKDDGASTGQKQTPWWLRLTVPHGWFTHFYVVGVLWNAVALFHSLVECAWAGSDPSVVGAAAASCLFQLHVTRRLYESAFVSIHRKGGRMHLVGYLLGIFYYLCVPLTIAHPLARASIVGSIAEMYRRGGWNRLRWLLAPLDPNKLAAATDGAAFIPRLVFTAGGRSGAGALISGFCVVGGVYAWAVGNTHQHRYHRTLASLRRGGDASIRKKDRKKDPAAKEYGVPRGGWFEYVSCPHYAAEVLLYCGLCLVVCGSGFGGGGRVLGQPGFGPAAALK